MNIEIHMQEGDLGRTCDQGSGNRQGWRKPPGRPRGGGERDYLGVLMAASAAAALRVAEASKMSETLCVKHLMRLRTDRAFSRCKTTSKD